MHKHSEAIRFPQTFLSLLVSIALTIALGTPVLGSDAANESPDGRRIFSTAEMSLAAVDDPSAETFLLYLHGAILELGDRRPTHPERGTYEYDQILNALADEGLVVISEQRPKGTVVADYADRAAGEVRTLLDAGAKPGRVTVVGFSKGGAIALHTIGRLGRDDVRFVVMAICGPWFEDTEFPLHGNILSIHEATDEGITSCRKVVERSKSKPASFEEIETNMGGGHGAFFKPQDAWMDPVVAWAKAGGERPATP